MLPIIDSHHHVWELAAHDQPFLRSSPELAPLRRDFCLADLAPLAAAAGVTATVVVQTVSEPSETPELLALATDGIGAGGGPAADGIGAGDVRVAAVVGWADLTAPGIADALAELAELPGASRLAGLRHPVLIEPDPRWLARPDVLRGLAAVARAGLVYDVVGRPDQLPAAAEAAKACPELLFVLDHLGNVEVTAEPDEAWAAALREFAAQPNTVAKLSGFLGASPPAAGLRSGGAGTEGARSDGAPPDVPGGPSGVLRVAHLRPYYELALECFGPGRLMFGSDWPVSTLGATYPDIVGAARALATDLSAAEQQQIFSGTARRVYRIAG